MGIPMAKRYVSTDLLNLTIETQIDAGVSAAEIHRLIYAFTPEAPVSFDALDEPVGFLWVDDIPEGYRGEFLSEILKLSAERNEPLSQRAPVERPKTSMAAAITILSRLGDVVRGALRPAVHPAPQA